MKKIDVFNHVLPKPFYELMMKVAPDHKDMGKRARGVPMLVDLDERFRVMDQFEDYHQILSLSSPPLEAFAGPKGPGTSRVRATMEWPSWWSVIPTVSLALPLPYP